MNVGLYISYVGCWCLILFSLVDWKTWGNDGFCIFIGVYLCAHDCCENGGGKSIKY